MKIFTLIYSIISVILIAFNLTYVDFNDPFNEESTTALITVMAILCGLVLVFILFFSKRIEQKIKERK
ncbi:MAG: hypothetical protein ACK5MZ_00205 [Aestuariibaculum sp.]